MDSITQGLLGGAVGQAIFGPKYGKRAGWLSALGAMAPDLDVLIRSSSDPMLALQFHRHFTHAAAFVPVGGLIVAAILYPLWRRSFGFKAAWLIAAIGYATHAPLDICTSYGTQYLWPFSDVRLSVDWIGIIDLFYSVPLLIGWVLAARRGTARPAAIAVVFTMAYLLLGAWQHHRAMNTQEALAESRGHTIERSRAMPSPLTLMMWRSLYEYDGRYYVDGVRVPLIGEASVYPGDSVAKVTADELTSTMPPDSIQAQDIRLFEWFTDQWLFRLESAESAESAESVESAVGDIGDLRYSVLPNDVGALWGITIDPAAPTEHIIRWNRRDRTRAALGQFWDMLLGR